ncbi:hypothetical protein, conserved [Trypanosoma brucei gambiense DAL972]|uniref:PSP1 C-terminal domain-containing protein n=1 Tax=Trypanosoma brucei gambiense (strain MHOM/CI/86/DAL972) TaxID=679716 RepID=D0A6Q8_TRYB9|nr:hypothetical protein, conserved [Trypanosoma brucei gambiense DAL972]CBH17359.1 hypothetical protein, conserved [Trypanosoma brucei gambiense DAL972]|eukprot:XP_011779623.1 hypothetical protein, conserved [Trypanosoma brucei gambiense DAL972]
MMSGSRESFSAPSSLPSTPHGLTPGAINFFMAANEGNQSCMDALSSITFAQLAGPLQPVYGPSRVPRHQQFVDLVTDSSGMSPFIPFGTQGSANSSTAFPVDNAYLSKRAPPESEGQTRAAYYNNSSASMQTPEKVDKPQMLRQVSVGAPTPSSGMGMTASPATVCRYITHATPGSALLDETCTRTYLRSAPMNFVASTGITTDNAIGAVSNAVLSAAAAALPSVKVSIDDKPTSLAIELEQAYEEHVHESKRRVGDKVKRKEKKVLVTVGFPGVENIPQIISDGTEEQLLNKEEVEQGKRRRERRQSRGKNKQKGDNNNNNCIFHDGDKFVSNFSSIHADNESHGECGDRKFLVTLRCHGHRDVTAICCLRLSKGKYVIFEADRGVDLGEVINVEELISEPSGNSAPAQVLRCALDEEVEDWKGPLVERENEAVEECRHVCEQLGLTIRVVGAAYQFDRQKLTFMYESDDRVDFRALLQVMFSKFRCRIWMERRGRGHQDNDAHTG